MGFELLVRDGRTGILLVRENPRQGIPNLTADSVSDPMLGDVWCEVHSS